MIPLNKRFCITWAILVLLFFLFSSCQHQPTKPEEAKIRLVLKYMSEAKKEFYPFISNKRTSQKVLDKETVMNLKAIDQGKVCILDMTKWNSEEEFLRAWDESDQELEWGIEPGTITWEWWLSAFRDYQGDYFYFYGDWNLTIEGDYAKGTFRVNPGVNFVMVGFLENSEIKYLGYNFVIAMEDKETPVEIEMYEVEEPGQPYAYIYSPYDGQTFTAGELITFEGEGWDEQDSVLTGSSLVWTSDKEGQIGTGERFTRDDLSVNEHAIVLTVTDSDGKTDAATVQISITESAVTIISIEVTPDSVTLQNGETQQFTCTALYSDRTTQDVTNQVNWSTSPGTAGSISVAGLFTADATNTGTETITANYEGNQAEATVTVTEAGLRGEMVLIPAGEFIMGSNDGSSDEQPVHTVYLDAYYIDKYEVTNAQYKEFCDATGQTYPRDPVSGYFLNYPNYPVVMVSWDDANAYAEWAGKRLPTEAEWEKAARGGLEGKTYPWGDEDPNTRCNYTGYSGSLTSQMPDFGNSRGSLPVDSFESNGYGLYNMAGNVCEWCADWYGTRYYLESPTANPQGPSTGEFRVYRGGSWYGDISYLRCADRDNFNPYVNIDNIGFRCVR